MISTNTQTLGEAAVDLVWRQWKGLGTMINADQDSSSVIDPEALLLLSLLLIDREKRLLDVLGSWAKHGSHLLSIQRVKNLLKQHPASSRERLADFATLAVSEGGDFRWRKLAGENHGPVVRNSDLWAAYPGKWHPSALLLRLRLAFGVGLAADLLGYLISNGGLWARPRMIAQATGYSTHSARRTAEQLAASGLVKRTRTRPIEFRVDTAAWTGLLAIEEPPSIWRYWHPVIALLADLLTKMEPGQMDEYSPYLRSTTLRDLFEKHQQAFTLNRINVPEPQAYFGEEYLNAIKEILSILVTWIHEDRL